ncbi:unnamed protein product [Larinioides sclopetarius]|uniref:F-box domain-containing protein n=1 Tax=Larinioides sclopetarius TaxID=280406 RepID=A0AAV2B8B2_9ARAC
MAPYPEEIDVFSAPHSRMKALVDVYLEKLTCTDFTDYAALESLLHDLHHTFCEFKSHEQIENKYIMKKLKKRLKLLSIHDAAVCNCHSDNKLSDMLALVEDGYSCTSKTEAERINFGLKLRQALQEFTGSFLPHMKEEEEVFQPMLMKYFEYEELKCLKEQVIEEHSKWHVYEKNILEEAEADLKLDLNEITSDSHISKLPPEILTHILSFLSPKDLLRCSEVCHEWYSVAKDPSLWKELYPCFWAHGVWENYSENHEDCIKSLYPDAKTRFGTCRDEDADIDEYEEEDSSLSDEASCEGVLKEVRALQSIVKHLLPHVGSGVQKIVVSSSRGLTSSLLRSILILCPNVLYLDVSYTSVLDSAFKGCLFDAGVLNKLQFLDVSGCWLLNGPELCSVTDSLTHLNPENIFYCDQILDGPYPDSANGCQNLESGIRACCRQVLL